MTARADRTGRILLDDPVVAARLAAFLGRELAAAGEGEGEFDVVGGIEVFAEMGGAWTTRAAAIGRGQDADRRRIAPPSRLCTAPPPARAVDSRKVAAIRVARFPIACVVGCALLEMARVVPGAIGPWPRSVAAAFERSSEMQFESGSGRGARALAIAVAAGGSLAGVAAGDAVEWRVADGGNGHWYALVSVNGPDFPAALAQARSLGGDLASITSASENQLLFDMSSATEGALIGANRFSFGSCGQSTWEWSDGEPFEFAGWAAGQPECEGEDEYLAILHIAHWGVGWHDVLPSSTYIRHALFEWSADCNANGLVDFGEIRNGLATDANGDNIPDECQCATHPALCCLGDVIESGVVDGIDLATILATWGTDGGKYPRADVDGSGIVDGADLAIVLGDWGPCE